jgi:hypothetical protein
MKYLPTFVDTYFKVHTHVGTWGQRWVLLRSQSAAALTHHSNINSKSSSQITALRLWSTRRRDCFVLHSTLHEASKDRRKSLQQLVQEKFLLEDKNPHMNRKLTLHYSNLPVIIILMHQLTMIVFFFNHIPIESNKYAYQNSHSVNKKLNMKER